MLSHNWPFPRLVSPGWKQPVLGGSSRGLTWLQLVQLDLLWCGEHDPVVRLPQCDHGCLRQGHLRGPDQSSRLRGLLDHLGHSHIVHEHTHTHTQRPPTLTHEASYLLYQPCPNLALSKAPGKLDIHLIPDLKAQFNSFIITLYTQLRKTETKATAEQGYGAHDT